MNYNTIYDNLIKSRKLLDRTKNNDGLLESHHIIPRCLNGDNSKDNKVLLTPREHYLAHWLLYKCHTGEAKAKLAYAFFKLASCNNKNQKRSFSSRQYEMAKNAMAKTCKGSNHPSYGKALSQAQKDNLRITHLGTKNPAYGKKSWNSGLTIETSVTLREQGKKLRDRYSQEPHPLTGRAKSIETRKKLSMAHVGKIKTSMHRENISKALTGRKLPKEQCDRMSRQRRGIKQKILTCPHCGKEGGTTMHRWHFFNCKTII